MQDGRGRDAGVGGTRGIASAAGPGAGGRKMDRRRFALGRRSWPWPTDLLGSAVFIFGRRPESRRRRFAPPCRGGDARRRPASRRKRFFAGGRGKGPSRPVRGALERHKGFLVGRGNRHSGGIYRAGRGLGRIGLRAILRRGRGRAGRQGPRADEGRAGPKDSPRRFEVSTRARGWPLVVPRRASDGERGGC